MGHVQSGYRPFPRSGAEAAAGIALQSGEHTAEAGAEMRRYPACIPRDAQPRHRTPDWALPPDGDRHPSRLCPWWRGGAGTKAKAPAIPAGTDTRAGAEDFGYDVENQPPECNPLERTNSGQAFARLAVAGPRSLATSRRATPPGREIQAVQ